MHNEDNLLKISTILKADGIVLFPADGVWGIACNSYSVFGLEKIFNAPIAKEIDYHEILVSDILMMKQHTKTIHPRVETLLVYHERPLKIIFKDLQSLPNQLVNQASELCIRIVKDTFTRRLIGTLGNPIYFISLMDKKNNNPIPFHDLDHRNFPALDYILKVREESVHQEFPLLIATIDEEGMIEILE